MRRGIADLMWKKKTNAIIMTNSFPIRRQLKVQFYRKLHLDGVLISNSWLLIRQNTKRIKCFEEVSISEENSQPTICSDYTAAFSGLHNGSKLNGTLIDGFVLTGSPLNATPRRNRGRENRENQMETFSVFVDRKCVAS